MPLREQPYDERADYANVATLIRAQAPFARHRVDYPWRLTPPTSPTGADRRIWRDEHGVIVGFAAWQYPWASLDFYVQGGPAQAETEAAIFAWADRHFQALDAARGRALPYWAEARDDDSEGLALLARHGYDLDDDVVYVSLSQSLAASPPQANLPAGYTMRPLAGMSEVDAYVEAHRSSFGSGMMTSEWRARTLQTPEYDPELDLVVIAPDGRIAGFCVGWLAPELRAGQIEPFGVAADFQGRGIGHALLCEILARFKAKGAHMAMVEVYASSAPARRAYEAAGFSVTHRALRKGRWASDIADAQKG